MQGVALRGWALVGFALLIGLAGCGESSDGDASAARDGGSRLVACLEGAGASEASSRDEIDFCDEEDGADSGAIYDADSGALVRQWSERGGWGSSGRWMVWSFDSSSGDALSVEQVLDAGGAKGAVVYMKGARQADIRATEKCFEAAAKRNKNSTIRVTETRVLLYAASQPRRMACYESCCRVAADPSWSVAIVVWWYPRSLCRERG